MSDGPTVSSADRDDMPWINALLRVGPVFLVAAVTLIVLFADWRSPGQPPARVVESRDLIFEVRGNEQLAIIDAETKVVVDLLPNTLEGFVATTVRVLGRGRRSQDVAGNPPFRLTRYEDGRLVLTDLGTGTNVELVGFGQTNFTAFANLLTHRRAE